MEVGCRLILWPWRSSSVETAGGLCTPNCTRGYYSATRTSNAIPERSALKTTPVVEPLIMIEARGRNPPALGLVVPKHMNTLQVRELDI
ncbi:hypothetical protein GEV33_015426 [Tenebrio molitor]|uniref:Uncharacterized protein n=1 Tax=Tenebrio molitor TaxID=7067 RepID=A0A8J6L3Z3_TENMO|nr:hypothetical protein GEV33_015426 [Tenebrio molitor]